MPDLGTVLEAEVEQEAPVVVEQETEQQESVETQEAKPDVEATGDARKLPERIRSLKATDPKQYREASSAWFKNDNLKKKLEANPDWEANQAWIAEQGGKDRITETLAEREAKATELDSINDAIAKGDGALVQRIAKENPDAFPKLAEATLAQWSQAEPGSAAKDSYERIMAGVIANTIASNGVPNHMARMEMRLGFLAGAIAQNPQAQEIFQPLLKEFKDLMGWANSFGEAAAKPPITPQNPRVDARMQEVETREKQVFDTDLSRDVDSFRQPLISKELESFWKGREKEPEFDDKKALAIADVTNKVVARLKADADLQKKLDGFYQRKDKKGFMQLLTSRETAAIKEIAPKSGRTIFGSPVAGKTAPVSTKAPVQQRQTAPVREAQTPKEKFLNEMFA